jgi:hypothetical protein
VFEVPDMNQETDRIGNVPVLNTSDGTGAQPTVVSKGATHTHTHTHTPTHNFATRPEI